MRLAIFAFLILAASPATSSAQQKAAVKSSTSGSLVGVVLATDNTPLRGVTVLLSIPGFAGVTNERGEFRIDNLPPGQYDVQLDHIGYTATRSPAVTVIAGGDVAMRFVMKPVALRVQGVVVIGSRRIQKVTEAPATVFSRTGDEIANSTGNSYMPVIKSVPGLEFTQIGLTTGLVNVRSFNSALNTRVLFVEDGRIAMVPETGVPVGPGTTIPKVDLDRVEVLVGPGSALYGPNASNGVVALSTKDPRQHPGLTIEATAGTRNFVDVQGRYAGVTGDWGYKLVAEHQQADEWTYDIAYSGNLYGARPPAPELETPHHSSVSRLSGALARYFGNTGRLLLNASTSEHDGLGMYTLGRIRYEDTKYRTIQLQFTSPRWFAQIYGVDSHPGTGINLNNFALYTVQYPDSSYEAIWDLSRFTASTRMLALEAQNNFLIEDVLQTHVVWGAQLRRDRVDSEKRMLRDRLTGEPIVIRETGIYAQSESRLADHLRLVLAARYDDHSRYASQISPKVALLYDINGDVLRLTFNRAYRAPGVLWTETYWPDVAPSTGVFGNVDGYYIKNSGGELIRTYAPLEPETNDTWELGYKGNFADRLFVDVSAYRSTYRNFISNAAAIASPFVGTTAVNARTGEALVDNAGLPLTVLSFFNLGQAVARGLDAGLRYYVNDHLSATTNLSFSDLESSDSAQTNAPDALSFNTSPARISQAIEVKRANYTTGLSLRYVKGYEFRGGVHYGRIPSFATLDAHVNYRVPNRPITLNVNAQNFFSCVAGRSEQPSGGVHRNVPATYLPRRECRMGIKHQEMINMPAIGPMLFLGIRLDTSSGMTAR